MNLIVFHLAARRTLYMNRLIAILYTIPYGHAWIALGTHSFKNALEVLGYPTYHMVEIIDHGGKEHTAFWLKQARGETQDFKTVFEGRNYTASCDFPSSVYWKQQLDQFPGLQHEFVLSLTKYCIKSN